MSQTSRNATNSHPNHDEFRSLYQTEHTSTSNDRLPLEPEKASRPWRQGINLRGRIITLAIAVAIPVLAIGAITYQVVNQPTTEQNNRERGTRSNNQSAISLVLVVEAVVAALLLIGLLAAYFANRAMRPVLNATTDEDETDAWEPSDLSTQLAQAGLVDSATPPKQQELALASLLKPDPVAASLLKQQEDKSELTQLLTEITLRLRQCLYLEDVLRTAVKEARRALKTDRVLIYGLDPNTWDGTVIAESVAAGWPQTLRVKLDDPCFRDRHVELYKKGQVTSIDDIHQDPRVTDCYRQMLEQFSVKANLVAPILKDHQLLGLMIAHQCSAPRTWQELDIDFFKQLATQVGFAAEQASFIEQQEAESERAQLATEITLRIRQCSYLEDVLNTTVKEVRRAIKADRVIIFGLDPLDWDGVVVAESVAPGLPQTLKVKIDDPCLRARGVDSDQKVQVTAINNIYEDPRVTDCYRKMLEQFAIKANLVAPIVKNNQLLGLMIAHQCSEPRVWQKSDIDLFAQLATQVGFAAEQASLKEQLEKKQARLEGEIGS